MKRIEEKPASPRALIVDLTATWVASVTISKPRRAR